MSIEQLPAHARPVAAAFVDGLLALGSSWVLGVYARGSVTMDDYQPGRSDLDLIVVTDRDPSSEQGDEHS